MWSQDSEDQIFIYIKKKGPFTPQPVLRAVARAHKTYIPLITCSASLGRLLWLTISQAIKDQGGGNASFGRGNRGQGLSPVVVVVVFVVIARLSSLVPCSDTSCLLP